MLYCIILVLYTPPFLSIWQYIQLLPSPGERRKIHLVRVGSKDSQTLSLVNLHPNEKEGCQAPVSLFLTGQKAHKKPAGENQMRWSMLGLGVNLA